VALLDPELTRSMPVRVTAATGFDALTHAIEGVVSTFHQPVCDAIGLECVRLIRRWLARAVGDGGDLEARGHLLLAASMAGQLVSLTFSGVSHAVAHALGVGWGVHHGTANAIALPWSIRLNARHPPSAAMYARCAEAWGLAPSADDAATAGALADAIEREVAALGLPSRLSAVGVTGADLPRLAERAFADPSHGPNPVKIAGADQLERLLVELV
jgi:alcohol dehydrogenase class IV